MMMPRTGAVAYRSGPRGAGRHREVEHRPHARYGAARGGGARTSDMASEKN